MKKFIVYLAIFIVIISIALSFDNGSSPYNFLTRSQADKLYSKQNNNITINNCVFDTNSNSSICFVDGHIESVVDIG